MYRSTKGQVVSAWNLTHFVTGQYSKTHNTVLALTGYEPWIRFVQNWDWYIYFGPGDLGYISLFVIFVVLITKL